MHSLWECGFLRGHCVVKIKNLIESTFLLSLTTHTARSCGHSFSQSTFLVQNQRILAGWLLTGHWVERFLLVRSSRCYSLPSLEQAPGTSIP